MSRGIFTFILFLKWVFTDSFTNLRYFLSIQLRIVTWQNRSYDSYLNVFGRTYDFYRVYRINDEKRRKNYRDNPKPHTYMENISK